LLQKPDEFFGENFLEQITVELNSTATAALPVEIKYEPARTIGFYKSALSKNLDPEIFKPNPWRLLWFGLSGFASLALFIAVVRVPMTWPLKLLCGVGIGLANGTLAFISHEMAHGSIVKNQKVQEFFGFFGALTFFISPTFWKFWHNRLHHGKTQQLIRDPDAFPNLRIYKSSKFMRFMFPFTPGSGHKRSLFYFFFWFSFHNFVAQVHLRFRNSVFDSLNQKRVTLEFSAQVLICLVLLAYAGPANWLYVLLIPLVIQNYMLMSYIATNHNLSPLTSENDPLINSLTVTNNPVLEFLNLNFGYHVEHHIFPTVSGAHAKAIHRELIKQFPDDYIALPKWKAVKALYSTSRIYKNANTLIHPKTSIMSPTLNSTNSKEL
jgi:fatty acid desaturase